MADIRFEAEIGEFKRRLRDHEKLTAKEVVKTVKSGAATFATVAARYTPPSIGKSVPDPRFYEPGVRYDASSKDRAHGRRRVYDLLQLARDPATGHNRSRYGKLLRKGFYYVVSIYRGGRLRQVPVEDAWQLASYTRETHRGLLRAAWGLSFPSIGMKIPASFSSLVSARPALFNQAGLAAAAMTPESVTLSNNVRDASGSWVINMESKAYYRALKTMNRRMDRFFSKKTEV